MRTLLPTTSQIDHRLSPKKEKGGRNRKEEKVPAEEARGARAGRRLRRRKERGCGGSPVVQAQRQRPEHIGRSSAGPPSPPCRPSSARPRPALRSPAPSSSGAPGGRRRRDLGDDSTGNARIRHLLRSLPPPVLPIFFPHAQRPSPPESTHSLDSCSSLSPPSASPHFPSSGDPLPTALEP
jgi:hypothetical protein